MPIAWNRRATFVTIAVFVAVLFSLQAGAQTPRDCVGACKDQYVLLDSFDKNTPESSIVSHFGTPSKIAKSKSFEIRQYAGADVDLLALHDAKSGAILGVAIAIRGLLDKSQHKLRHARIPYLHGGEYDQRTKKVTEFRTLGDFAIPRAQNSCDGAVTEVDAKFAFMWTPKCYFGKGGSYMNYSFLYEITGCDNGKPSIFDEFEFEKLKCPRAEGKFPRMVLVTESDSIGMLAKVMSRFSYWGDLCVANECDSR
jgi:hypothetical protein